MGIRFEQVTYTHDAGSPASHLGLDALDLTLEEGRFIAVLGAPGSGKSTLLQHFNGILLPQSGRIRILDFEIGPGKAPKGLGKLRKRVGLVFQFPEQQLFEETVEKDICFGPLNFGLSPEAAKAAAVRALRDLGLEESLLGRSPFQLSGGQMRKVALATVLAADPDVLVLDEPTATLDQMSREELLRLLRNLVEERGKTVIVVTHRLEEVLEFADEYVVMHRGKAVFHGGPAALLERADLLEEAGINVPASVRFLRQAADRFGAPFPEGPYGTAAIADFIAGLAGPSRSD